MKAKSLKRTLALLISVSMCIGMFLPVSAAGYTSDEAVLTEDVLSDESVETKGEDKGTEEVPKSLSCDEDEMFYYDGTDGILQAGGLIRPVSEYGEEEVLGINEANYDAAFAKVGDAISAWNKEDPTIEVDLREYEIPKSEIKYFWSGAVNKNPQGFFLMNQCGYSLDPITECITTLTMNVAEDFDPAQFEEFNNKVQEIIDGADPEWTDLQKVLYVHDYLVLNAQYEKKTGDKYKKFNAYNAIVEGECVCQGYSLAFEYLLNLLDDGFDCDIVTSEGIDHAWNVLTLNGKKYYVDCTWDDPVGCYKYYCRYTNFLKSKAAFVDLEGPEGKHGQAQDWVDSYGNNIYSMETGNEYDDFFWKDMKCSIPMIYESGFYYTLTDNGSVPGTDKYTVNIRCFDFSAEETGDYECSFDTEWLVWNEAAVYDGVYTSLGIVGDYLIATACDRAHVFHMYDDVADERVVDVTEGYIYSAMVEDGILYYQTGTSPNFEESVVNDQTLDLSEFDVRQYQNDFTLDPVEKTVTFGCEDFTINALNAKTAVSFSSADEDVAVVDGEGKVHITGAGNTRIMAVAEETDDYHKAKDFCEITVNKKTITVNDITKELYYDKKNTVSINLAELIPDNAGTLTSKVTKILCDETFFSTLTTEITDNTLLYKTPAVEDEVADTTLTVQIKSKNYSDITFNVIFKYSKTPDTEPDPEPGPDPDPDPVPESDPYFRETFTSDTKDDAGKSVVISVVWSKSVPYSGKKHINTTGTAKKNVDTDVTVSLNSALAEYATPVIKFKNNKNMSVGAEPTKQPWFTISYKAKRGISKEKKKFIKDINKELKTKFYKFEIAKAVLDDYVVVDIKYKKDKDKVSKLVISNSKNTFKLKKSDFNHKFTEDGKVIIEGIGKYTGKITYKLPGAI